MTDDFKPSRNEDEFFLKQDAELLAEHRARLDAERERVERSAHYMKCPKCGQDLTEKSFSAVKVDVCSGCNGMWLDAGELELLNRVDSSRLGGFVRSLFGLEK
jgi:uncharacterized protein